MNSEKKRIFRLSLMSVILLITLWILKDFNLSWVEVNQDYAKVTINFLFPMNKDKLSECITLTNQLPYAKEFDYAIEWLTDSVVSIKLKEQNIIKGQKVQLIIKQAPSQLGFISRNARINIQFTSDVVVLEPNDNLLISTVNPFMVKFNTPMNKNKLYKFLQCDTTFYIEPTIHHNHLGKEIEDPCAFMFTPKNPLENDRKYILSFRKGMPAQSGVLLKEDLHIILTTDTKPIIAATYPANNSKWIGLYPILKLETDSPTATGQLTVNNETITAKNLDPYHLEFLLGSVLKPNTTYRASFQVKAASGELSVPKEIEFTTVRIDPDKVWVEVLAHNRAKVNVYKGNQLVKSMACSIGDQTYPLSLGTYYIQDKNEALIDSKNREGANFWMKINDTSLFQGLIRDEYWNIKYDYLARLGEKINRPNIVLKDDDARWLYDNIAKDTMVIIHK